MADEQRRDDLFRPISLDERFSKPAPKPMASPKVLLPGQLYGSAMPPLAPPKPLNAQAASPAPPPLSGPAPESELPPYLQKRPALAPWPAQQPPAPAAGRIASTFPKKREPEADAPPQADASPRRRRTLKPREEAPEAPQAPAAPVYAPPPWAAFAAPTQAAPPMPCYPPCATDEIAAFFAAPPPEEPAPAQEEEEDFYPLPADEPEEWSDGPYEYETLPASAELSPEEEPDEPYEDPMFFAPEAPKVEFLDDKPEEEPPGPAPAEAPAPAPAYTPGPPSLNDFPKRKKKPRKPKKAPSGPQKPPILPGRVAALVAAAGMLLFCLAAGGRILYRLAANEQEMRRVKDEYLEARGNNLLNDAVRVEPPLPGETLLATPAPAATPAPTQAPAPAEGEVSAILPEDGDLPAATASGRVRLSRYPKNTLRNILDSMKPIHDEFPEAQGRLVIPGLLDEIVAQRNNTYYLNHTYRGSLSEAGAIFMDETCTLKTPPENLLLRGQGSVAGKAFAPLWQFQTGGADFVAAHTSATLTTLYEEEHFLLLAVIVADSNPASPNYFNYASYPSFATDEEMMTYVSNAVSRSLYRFSTTVEPSDRLLTLATVSSRSDTQCIVLLYRMVRDGEM